MQGVRNKLFFHDSKGKIKNYMGVELEISNFDPAFEGALTDTLNKWKANCGGDGSIEPYGPNQNSFEIKTAPARGVAFINQLTDICGVLAKGKAKANESCGMHVHIDARSFTPDDLIKVAAVWPKVESKFWTKTYSDRQDSGYCESWGKIIHNDHSDYDENLFRAGSLMSMYEQVRDCVQGDRMMSLNFTALGEHGTLENRMHHGTVSFRKILAWASLNDKFFNKVRAMTVDEALKFTATNKIIRTKLKEPLKRKSFDDKISEAEDREYAREERAYSQLRNY